MKAAKRNCDDSHLSKFYWKVKQRRGAKKAIVALARKILVIVYNIQKNIDMYKEEKFEIVKQNKNLHVLTNLLLMQKNLALV